MDKEKVIMYAVLSFLIGIHFYSAIAYSLLSEKYEGLKDNLRHYEMYTDIENSYPTGVYKDNYMCIYLKGREYWDIIKTCHHEVLHYQYGKEHFE